MSVHNTLHSHSQIVVFVIQAEPVLQVHRVNINDQANHTQNWQYEPKSFSLQFMLFLVFWHIFLTKNKPFSDPKVVYKFFWNFRIFNDLWHQIGWYFCDYDILYWKIIIGNQSNFSVAIDPSIHLCDLIEIPQCFSIDAKWVWWWGVWFAASGG